MLPKGNLFSRRKKNGYIFFLLKLPKGNFKGEYIYFEIGEGECMDKTIRVEDLYVSYDGNRILTDVHFQLETGRLIGIIGANGSGKSTLMKAMLGLIERDRGAVTVEGKTVEEQRKRIAYVPQRATIDWDFPITVLDTVLLGTYPSLGLFRRPKKKHRDWAHECLETVGMEQYAERQIGELSGGQQQRVFLARALAQKADYFFLDEPFVGIDVTSEALIIDILKKLRDEGKTILVVHHNLTQLRDYFNDLIVVKRGVLASGPVDEVMTSDVLKEAFQVEFAFLEDVQEVTEG